MAGRPLSALTRRDVALALLTVSAQEALGSLPGLRRGMLAASNPLSAVFWASAEAILHKIDDGDATVGDVRTWLEATGTEPNGIIGLHVWDEMSDRSQLAAEMHTRLISHLEERLAAGEIDPDLLAAADPAACQAHIELQERWMTSALPDGRVPMDVLLDEEDEELFAEWDAADANALVATRALLERVGDRPLAREELRRVSARLRQDIARPGWPGQLLTECSGLDPEELPADDTELWLQLAAGVASRRDRATWTGRIPMRPKASSPLSAPSTISTGWRRSPRSPRAARAPPRPPPTWLATCATTIRGTPKTQTAPDPAQSRTTRTSPTTSSCPMTTTSSTTSPWRACSCR